jgi:hypothetical protein
MRLKNWDKGEVHRAFPQVLSEILINFVFQDIELILCLSCRKKHINPCAVIF